MVADLKPDSVVLEIGPGTGMLTRALLQRAGRVIAVETDYELYKKLEIKFCEKHCRWPTRTHSRRHP